MAPPTGESESDAVRLDFDRRRKLDFHGSNVTADAGLPPFRPLDDVRGWTGLLELRCQTAAAAPGSPARQYSSGMRRRGIPRR